MAEVKRLNSSHATKSSASPPSNNLPTTMPSSTPKKDLSASKLLTSGRVMVKREPQQDRSGHVCFDIEMTEFYRTCQLRADRIERAHLNGMIGTTLARNPLRGEKTPRQDYKIGFDFTPPPLPESMKPPERLNYDPSVLPVVNKASATLPTVKEERQLSSLSSSASSSLSAIQSISMQPTTGNSASEERKQPLNPRSAASASASRPLLGTGEVLLEASISEFKKKVNKDPLLLAKWRAEKAADYIGKQSHPLTPPSPLPLESRGVFLPVGSVKPSATKAPQKIVKKETQMDAPQLSAQNTAGVLQTLHMLRSQLQATENEIERQQLKLALMSRSKNYQKPTKVSH